MGLNASKSENTELASTRRSATAPASRDWSGTRGRRLAVVSKGDPRGGEAIFSRHQGERVVMIRIAEGVNGHESHPRITHEFSNPLPKPRANDVVCPARGLVDTPFRHPQPRLS